MVWYRVEFDSDGNRVSCRVAYPAADEGNVFYVMASDDERAWKQAHSLRVRALQRVKSAERIEAGQCPRCGVGKYDGSTRCAEFCKPEENKRKRNDRARAQAQLGEVRVVVPEHLEPQLTREERLRLTVLQECRAEWRSPRNFLTWIEGEIGALTTKLQKAG